MFCRSPSWRFKRTGGIALTIARQLDAAIKNANIKNLDEISRTVWRAFSAGHIADIDADKLSAAIETRRAAYKVQVRQGAPRGSKASERRSRGCKSPDRAQSMARRRSVAMSGAVPSPLACKFTMGELAVLSLIAQQIQRRGVCDWPMDRLAACAGVCRTTARNALREAEAQELITVEERRRSYTRSDTNIVRIISWEWRSWLRLGGGCKKTPTTNNHFYSHSSKKLFISNTADSFHLCSRATIGKSSSRPHKLRC